MSEPARPRLALTMGDPAGVGPELCLRALADAGVRQACLPILFGDLGVAREVGRRLGLPVPETVIDAEGLDGLGTGAGAAVVDLASLPPGSVEPGTVRRACGAAAYRAIEAAIGAAMSGRVAGVVTAPINKEALNLAGVPHPGHTEIFTALTEARRSCMLLCADAISCSFVTTHTAIAQVSGRLSVERILDVIELTADALQRLRGRPARIGVCGLNPHAGEHGLFGDEEARVIEPAMAEARSRGIAVEGPFPPDAAFLPKLRARIDATVCMYHDQGHIPFKMLAFDSGVNVTLGLPIVRTSVDHGTAFDIAWQGRASPSSLLAAIRCAVRLAP